LAAVALLALAGCGGGASSTPVEGQTTPTTTVPATSPPATTTATTPAKIDAAAQLAKLEPCVGGVKAETFKWFQPTVDYASSMGGGGFTVTLGGKPMLLIVFPWEQAAQLGFKDIQDRLIALQQKRPADYATVAATAAQPVGNVLEVATQGGLDAPLESKVHGCITTSRP
jgi:hypothetical protein